VHFYVILHLFTLFPRYFAVKTPIDHSRVTNLTPGIANPTRRAREPKDWEPPRQAGPRLSRVSLKAEDAIEYAAATGRTPRPSTAAERGMAVEEQYEANIHQPMPRTSTSGDVRDGLGKSRRTSATSNDGQGRPRTSSTGVATSAATARQNEASRVEARMSQMSQRSGLGGEASASYRTSTSHGGAPRLSVHELRADDSRMTAVTKLPLLPIPRRLKEKLRYHEEQDRKNNRPGTTTSATRGGTAASSNRPFRSSSLSSVRNSSQTPRSHGDEHYDEHMDAIMHARQNSGGGGGGGFPLPRPRMLDPAAGGHGTRPTTSGELMRGPSLINAHHASSTNSLASLYITRRRSPPRQVDTGPGGFEIEGTYAARTTSRSGRFIKPFKTLASKQWNVSGEPWTGSGGGGGGSGMEGGGMVRSDSFVSGQESLPDWEEGEEEEGEGGQLAGGSQERPKTSSSKFPQKYNRGGPSPTDDSASYIGDEGEVLDSWPHQQDELGGSIRAADSSGDFFDTQQPAKPPYAHDKRHL
jgi:hypothetical protein